MVYCSECGYENKDNEKFCQNCGYQISNDSLKPDVVPDPDVDPLEPDVDDPLQVGRGKMIKKDFRKEKKKN